MQVDFLIIGQGISGTFLSRFLHQSDSTFLVIDNNDPKAASRVAAGIVNPVTGRRIVKTWMIDELLPFVYNTYHQLGTELNIQAISQKNIIEFFPSAQIKNAFEDRLKTDDHYLKNADDLQLYEHFFNYDLGFGEIDPCYIVHLEAILPAWRKKLIEDNLLWNETFDPEDLSITSTEVVYKNVTAQKIIFCDGVSCLQNPWFKNLPFSQVKGEALIIEAADIPSTHIFKKGMILAPMNDPGYFWVGSNYLWEYKDPHPTEMFRAKTEQTLKEWLKVPFKVVNHIASIRPATLERRPFVGLHPQNDRLGILNGMGTKGCSLAPFFALQLCNHLVKGTPIMPEAHIDRFSKTLIRN